MNKEKEILNKTLTFNYGNELDKIHNHISTLRFVAISSVNSLEEKEKEIERLHSIIKEVREYIEKNWISQKDADNCRFDDEELDIEISDIAVLYDILDKGSDKE